MYTTEDDAWPEDMELRRLADLDKFIRDNPDYMMQLPPSEQQKLRNEIRGKKSSSGTTRYKQARVRTSNDKRIRWDVASTLDLLEALKAFVRSNKVSSVGGDIQKWKMVASRLSTPDGVDQTMFARSCQLRFLNLQNAVKEGRTYKEGRPYKRRIIEDQVQRSLDDLFQISKVYLPPPKSTKRRPSSPRNGNFSQTSTESNKNPADDSATPSPVPHAAARRFTSRSEKIESRSKIRAPAGDRERFFKPAREIYSESDDDDRFVQPASATESAVQQNPQGDDDESEYEVDGIVGHRIDCRKGSWEYFVTWKGYDSSECTWEPERNLKNAEQIVREYRLKEGL